MNQNFGSTVIFQSQHSIRTQIMQITRLVILLIIAVMAVNGMVTLDLTEHKRVTSDNRIGADSSYPALSSFSGDYMIANRYDYFGGNSGFSIYKWDAVNTEYNSVFNYSMLVNNYIPITNGKWFVMYAGKTNKYMVFQLDADNQMTQLSYIDPLNNFISTYFILTDDTLIIPSSDGFSTYSYDGSAWNLDNTVPANILSTNLGVRGLLMDVSDTHLLLWNSTTSFNIYERSGLQWTLLETHQIDAKYISSVENGITTFLIDRNTVVMSTFVFGDPNLGNHPGLGYVAVFSKTGSNGVWQDQIISPDAFNLPSYSFLGLVSFVIDSNNILLGAPNAGAGVQFKRSLSDNSDEISKKSVQGSETGSFGAAVLLQRNTETNQWRGAAQFVIDKNHNYYFGTGFGKNSHGDIMVMSCEMDDSIVSYYHCLPYSFPKCIVDPMNVTCNDVALDDCSSVDLNNLGLYTQNDLGCGVVDASFQNIGYKNNKFTATLAFSRPLDPSPYSCNVTASCPLPPVTPVSAAPVTVPVAAPGKKVSSGMKQSLTAVILVVSMIGVLLM